MGGSAYLHGGRGSLATAGAQHTWTYSDDRYGRAAKLHSWLAAPGATITEKQGELTYIKGDYAKYPYLQLDEKAAACAWLTLLKPASPGDKAVFTVEDLSMPAFSAFSVIAADHRCLVVAQSKPGTLLKAGDLETDAAFALVRRNSAGRVLSYCVLDGTTLTVDGRKIWHSVRPVNAAGPVSAP